MRWLALIVMGSASTSSYANLYIQPNLTTSFGYNVSEHYATEQRVELATKLEFSTENIKDRNLCTGTNV